MFTPASYVELIRLFQSEGYRFALFDDFVDADEKIVYLRHDIDYSPRWAAEFGRLNQECGVQATFCFRTRCPLFNLAAPTTLQSVDTIIRQGHRVGLHFAFVTEPDPSDEVLALSVQEELAFARRIVPNMMSWFSWHNPGVQNGLIERCLDLEVPGLINLYGRRWVRDTTYKSDSNWRYTIDEWHSIARAGHRRLQLLFHPFQWMAGGTDMSDVLVKTMVEVIRSAGDELRNNRIWLSTRGPGLEPQTLAAVEAALRLHKP